MHHQAAARGHFIITLRECVLHTYTFYTYIYSIYRFVCDCYKTFNKVLLDSMKWIPNVGNFVKFVWLEGT